MSFKEIKEDILLQLEHGKLPNYKSFSDELKQDFDITQAACAKMPFFLKFAPEKFKKNKEFVLPLVQQEPFSFQFVDKTLKDDLDFVIECIVKTKGIVYFLCPSAVSELDKIRQAAQSCGLKI